ncbi:hypothetical protein Tc00.1047053506267.19 [Trypanosoma cruzi]|uniref:Uncharacterized protein n=1 Tax=Trypanosoma cruzi (strain CL Brener) TaxID=353153 RepID=Q4DCE9_TRYCC|nr:hypothetical protein Tc00.1047053506267.19 [Trypanosoma cruzi]EAN90202.1 hypothetical protein Tc00.1047053506267.19 [Trypanosoma cruzi]|eukprot:XP_812053.1 hypothetical protein [Trypanosoma cruzi strain CL Brener]
MQALRVCVQVPCNNVTTNMLRLGDPHIVVVLTNSRGTARIDALSGRSEASFEAQQGTGCVDAATTCMECHDGTVGCGWWNIYFSEATKRERELLLLLASLLPFVVSHADYCLSADHGWHASTSDVVCRHFTAPVKHTSRRMLWLWMWCRECSRHYFARLLFTALRRKDASPPEPFAAAPCVVLPAQDSVVVRRLVDGQAPLRWDMQGCGLPLTVLGTAVWMRRPHERMYCGTIKCAKYAGSQWLQ